MLNPEQLIILAVLGSFLTMIFRVVIELLRKAKITLPQWVWLVIVAGVSVVLSMLWFPQAFPPLPVPSGDPSVDFGLFADYLNALVVAVSAILAMAVVIYKALIEKVKTFIRRSIMPRLL